MIEDYPKDLMSFYGQGYSISRFLIEMGGRPRFLRFVRDGLKDGWDPATRIHYQLTNVRELDRAWRSWHRVTLQASRDNASVEVVALACRKTVANCPGLAVTAGSDLDRTNQKIDRPRSSGDRDPIDRLAPGPSNLGLPCLCALISRGAQNTNRAR